MTAMTTLRFLFFPALLLVPACSSISKALGKKEPDPTWVEREVEAPSDRVLWKISLLSVEAMGFPLAGGLDPSAGEITSGWDTQLAPFSRQGYRKRAILEMKPVSPGQWKLRGRVQKQINEAIVNPLDPSRAEWKWEPDDTAAATILLHRIVSLLDPEFEIEEEEDPLDALMKGIEGEE